MTGAVLDVGKAVYRDENNVPIVVYAPLRSANGNASAASEIYVTLKDPKTLSGFLDMSYARRNGGEPAAQNYARQHRDVFLQKRDVSGLVYFGRRDPVGDWAKVGLDAANITFIEDGWSPNPGLGYTEITSGFVLSLICLGMIRKGRRG